MYQIRNTRRQSQVYSSYPLQPSFYDQLSAGQVSNETIDISNDEITSVASQHFTRSTSLLRPELINFDQSQCSMQPGQRVQSPHQVQVQPAFEDLQSVFGGASLELYQFAHNTNVTINVLPVSETIYERSEQTDLTNKSLCQVPYDYSQVINLQELQFKNEDCSVLRGYYPNYAPIAQNSAARAEVQPEAMDFSNEGDICMKDNQTVTKVSLPAFSVRSKDSAAEFDSKSQPATNTIAKQLPKPSSVFADNYRLTLIVPKVAHPPTTTPVASQTSTEASSPKASPSSKVFKCPHCPQEYSSSRALGGHASKTHKGMSETFLHKMNVRQARFSERMALKVAKDICGRFVIPEYRQKDRHIQTMIRNEILAIRKADLDAAAIEGEINPMSNAWCEKLIREICSSSCPKAQKYCRWFGTGESQ